MIFNILRTKQEKIKIGGLQRKVWAHILAGTNNLFIYFFISLDHLQCLRLHYLNDLEWYSYCKV